MALASSEELAAWLRANADKKGTPDYQTVLRGFQEAVVKESAVKPAAPTAKPESGFFPALRAGKEELMGGLAALAGRTGLMDVEAAQKEYEARQQKAKEIFAPTEAGWTESPVTKTLELLGGSLPYVAAPLVAGAGAATLPVTGTAATVLGLGAAGLASTAQFTATNLSRQLEEGKGKVKIADTDLGAAALAAVPQAALDTLSLRMIPGIGRIFGRAGVELTEETAKKVVDQGLKKVAADYALATGKTMGVEGLTEAAQQVFERAQAGLNITDEAARKEYFDSFLGGAVLGGTLAPAGRYLERGSEQRKAKQVLQDVENKRAAEAQAAEEARKKTPEYALKLDADYQAAVAKMKELQAAVPKKPGKDALPEERMAYQEAKEARDTHLNEVLKPLTAEWRTRQAEIAQLKERQRVEGLTPEEYMLEQMGVKPTATSAADFTTLEEAALDAADLSKTQTAPEASAVEKYVADRIELANQQTFGTATANDYVDYLMQDPGMAAQVAASKIALPGLDRKTNAAVLSALKLQLKEKVGARLSQEQADLAAQQQVAEKDPLALWKASLEQTEEQATEELLRFNFETLRPSGPATVAVPENITPMQNPGVMLARIDDLIATRDQAARDAETAFAAGNKELGAKKAAEREAAQSALNNISQSEGAPRAIVELRKAQDTALLNTAQLTDDLKSGRVLGGPEAGTASSTPETLINQINKQREAFIKAAVQEAATIRRLFGKSITQEEATAAAKEMQAVFDEWVTRSMAQPRKAVEEERVVQPAQMRGTELVEGAITERVDPRPLEERQFGAYKAATQVLQEQLQKIVSKLTEVPKEGKRVEPVLKTQFASTEAGKVAEERGETAQTLEGALRRRRDYVDNLIDQALQTRNVPGIARMLLERAQDFLQKPLAIKTVDETTGKETVRYQPRGTTAFLDAAENLASRLVLGQNIERSDLVDLRNELRAESARPGEAEVVGEREGQRELFGTEERRKDLGVIRETRARFENAPIVKRARAAAEKAKKLLEDLRVAFDAADAAAEKAKASKIKKAETDVEARREDLREAFQTALNKAQIAEVTAKFQPQIDALIQQLSVFGKERAKALREKETVYAKDLEVIIQAERETLQDLRRQLTTALKAPAAAVEPAALPKGATRVVRGLTQPAELAAAGDEWVQFERDRLAKAESKLRNLKGPERTTVAKEVKQQRAKVNETESIVTRARTGLGLPGLRRVAGKVEQFESAEKIAETQAQAAKERRAEAAETAAASAKIKEEQTAALENKILESGTEIENQKAAFKRAKTQESKTKIGERIEQLTKDVRIAEGQLEAQGEKKPRRKGPATAPSSAALMKQKPLRTGYRKALEAASEGMRAEREGEMQLESWTLGDINLSRGATANPSTTDSVRAELKKQFPDLGRVQIYDSVDALIKANPQYKGKIPADARGFVDTAGNKAFLIAENINQGQALSVLLHEVGAHIGMRETLGKQYNASINAVENWAKKDDGSLESRIAKAAQARVEKADTPASQQRDELIAYAVEEAVNAGVKPTETKSPIGRWLGQIMSMFRNALRKFGLASKDLTAQELVDMAYGAAKMEMTPKAPQLSRRQFLRGAGAALGALKLPPLSKEMNLKALRSVFEGSLSARDAWFGALKTAVKGKGLGRVIDQYEDVYEGDNALVNFTQSGALQDFLQRTTYDENYQGDGYDYYLNELLSGKDGVKVVADLQQALRAQGASLVEAAQRTAKEKGLPEVGELFFSDTEKPSAFKRWFGDSKVVDENGEPLVVYHGTANDFSVFDRTRAGKATGDPNTVLGFFFTDSKKEATQYGPITQRVYLSIKKPYNATMDELVGLEEKDYIELREQLIQEGYDGIVAPFDDADGSWFVAFEPTQIKSATKNIGTYDVKNPDIFFSRKTDYAPGMAGAGKVADMVVAKQPSTVDKIRKNLFGLEFRTQVIDALAPLEKIANTSMDALKGTQMMYYLRMYGMRNNMTAQAISNGVPQLKEITRADGRKEWIFESVKGANIKQIVERLSQKDVVQQAGSPDAANRLFTLYMAAIRGENVGYDKLNFGRDAAEKELVQIKRELASPRLSAQDKASLLARQSHLEKNIPSMPTEADFKSAKAEIENNPTLKNAFNEARGMYNEYNTNLLNFLVQVGAMSKEEAARLLRAKDYIPYYRMRGGNAELVIGGETPIRIGNLKDSPHLQELVGGEEPIFNFLDSSVQNTSMLLDMGMRNIATKNVAFELGQVGLASKPIKTPVAGAPTGTLEFKKDGVDYYVTVNTDYIGVPSDLLVKGMAGIPTMLPQGLRLMGVPSQILRRAVTSTPVFAVRQLFRESLGAFMLSGSDATPLLSSINQLRKDSSLEARGITGGQVFTGTTEDMSRLLREMQSGRPGWSKAFAKMEAFALKTDAATRQAQFESYRNQGLSEMEASFMALESMNFSKRGLSATMHMASMLVPFLNAQIQGLDVLYKGLTGNMPLNEKLDIQRKVFTRGAMMFMATMAYAAAMQDDEEYKNAPPDQKYGNWFVRLPFLDEIAGEKVTLRVPVPFEIGYVFKSLPEMLYNSLQSKKDAEDAFKALNHILIQMVPGGSSMVPIELGGVKVPVPVPIPAAMKPVIEVGLGKSFFTGRDIESAREQQEVPGMRYRQQTSELAKLIGEAVNFSPIKIESLINGYTGGLGLLAMQALSVPLPKASVVVPESRWSELPLVGTMFQPSDAGNIIDGVYKDFEKVKQAKTTYDRLIEKGETGKAQAFLQENLQLITLNHFAGNYTQRMRELTKNESIIRGSNLTAEEKRTLLDQIKQAKIQTATAVRGVLEKRGLQASPA